MNLKLKLISFLLISGYIFLLIVTFIYNNSLESDFRELSSSLLENDKYATLVDSKGHFIVSNQQKYEAWIDLEYMKRRGKYDENKYILNRKFGDEELQNKKFIKWGSYNSYEEAYLSLGVLNKFSRIYPVTERLYNELFTLGQVTGKFDKTVYGIEPFLFESGALQNNEEIILSIDLKMQQIAYEELMKTVIEESAEGGIVIIMETSTGKIRASVSIYPWNMGYMGYIEPGSTLKPLLVALAIDENIITPNNRYYSGYEYYPTGKNNFRVTESQGYGFGEIGLKETLAYSSNIAITKIMNQILEEFSNVWLYEKLLNLGFGNKTGIEFKGEINGVLPSPNNWYEITPYQIALGQGIGVTPIQLVASFNALANKGKYVSPTFLEKKEVKSKQIFSETSSNLVKDWLGYTVINGTARKAYKEGLKVAGKTGTAQKAQSGVGYVEGSYYSLFSGFIPATNPQYTALVIIDNPQKEYYGGEVAAPILTNIFYRYYKDSEYMDNKNKIVFYEGIMPDLTGFSVVEAVNVLLNLGIDSKNIIITGNGDKITTQSKYPFTSLKESDIIHLHTLK